MAPKNTSLHQLHDALESLEVMAAAREPSRTMVITGAIGLNGLCERRIGGQSMLDAAAVLTSLATGGAFKLDGAHRLQYERLANAVRGHVASLESIEAARAGHRDSRRRAVSC